MAFFELHWGAVNRSVFYRAGSRTPHPARVRAARYTPHRHGPAHERATPNDPEPAIAAHLSRGDKEDGSAPPERRAAEETRPAPEKGRREGLRRAVPRRWILAVGEKGGEDAEQRSGRDLGRLFDLLLYSRGRAEQAWASSAAPGSGRWGSTAAPLLLLRERAEEASRRCHPPPLAAA
ncbi:unnamed protein product [Urochloa humidicola]